MCIRRAGRDRDHVSTWIQTPIQLPNNPTREALTLARRRPAN